MSESFIDFRYTTPEGLPRRVVGTRRAFELLYGPFVEVKAIEPNPTLSVSIEVKDGLGCRREVIWPPEGV